MVWIYFAYNIIYFYLCEIIFLKVILVFWYAIDLGKYSI